MITFTENIIECQSPANRYNIERRFVIINCSLRNDNDLYTELLA